MERQARRWLALILVAFGLLGALYSVVVPLFEAPDELWHFSFVRVLATQRALPRQPSEGKDMWLREAGQPPIYYFVTAPFIAPLDSSDLVELARFNVAHPAVTASSTSQAHNIFIHTPRENFPYRGAALAMHMARLLTIPWGAAAILGVYLVARQLMPARPGLALASAAIAAFNPHVIFISSIVNNDAAAICLGTYSLWLIIRLGQGQASRRAEIALGLVLGLALLSKVSALALLPLLGLALCLLWWQERDTKALLTRSTRILGPAALVGAWWYLRNWMLYGDPLAWRVWLIDIGVQPIGLGELVRQFGQVATSFWSPYDGLFPPVVFWALGLVMLLTIAGWVRLVARREVFAQADARGLLLAGTWFALLFASLVRYMTITPAAAGRLLFPGLAAFGLFVVLGLDALFPRRWSGLATGGVGVGLLFLSLITPWGLIAPRFARPLLDSAPDLAGDTTFDDALFGGARLLGLEITPEQAQAGDMVNVTLYWQAQSAPPEDLRAVVRLWTVGGRLISQRDATPAGEAYPPDLWRTGDVVRDVYRLPLHESGPAMCRVTVSVLDGEKPLREMASGAVLRLAGDEIAPDEITRPLAYTLGGKIELLGYDVAGDDASPRSAAEGEALEVTLYWRALTQPDQDYTVFMHLLDQNGALLGQGDGPPLDADYPSSHWLPGQLLSDTHIVQLSGDLPPGAHLLVGLYRLSDGVRLPAYDVMGERALNDAIRLVVSPAERLDALE